MHSFHTFLLTSAETLTVSCERQGRKGQLYQGILSRRTTRRKTVFSTERADLLITNVVPIAECQAFGMRTGCKVLLAAFEALGFAKYRPLLQYLCSVA
jgi:hypothetical protein